MEGAEMIPFYLFRVLDSINILSPHHGKKKLHLVER